MNDFTFNYPTKVYFGKEAAKKALTAELKDSHKKIMLAYGGGSIKKNGIFDEIMSLLKGREVIEFSGIMSNPTYNKVQEGAALAKENNVNFILAVGGGSVIDCCKMISVQAMTDEDIWKMEFEERKLPQKMLPMGAVVTASGTGSEMNSGAVITNEAVMRNTIRNIRALIKDPNDIDARGELMWDSAMAENSLLKIGKVTDFQAHQIEHQLGAYTDCNHGQGLAVIHPVLYRHIYKNAVEKFARFAKTVWNITEGTDEELALKGINALSDFISEIGLPANFREMGITDKSCFEAVAKSSNITAGCCKKLTSDEILEILEAA